MNNYPQYNDDGGFMQIRYSWTRGWEIRFVQCGAPSGWAEWEVYDRLSALAKIEAGWEFAYVE